MPWKDKERKRAYSQKWYAANKERQRAYSQKPEVKERQRAYSQKPEVKERKRAYHNDIGLICRRTELAADGIGEIVKEIRAGRRYIDIAVDWLIDEGDVCDIARVHKLGRKSRSRGRMRAVEARP